VSNGHPAMTVAFIGGSPNRRSAHIWPMVIARSGSESAGPADCWTASTMTASPSRSGSAMAKAKAHPGQLAFCYDAPALPRAAASLAGLEKRISAMVGTILATAASEGRSRGVIAAEMGELLGEKIK